MTAAPGTALNILVVEDDERVLAATVDAVDELGHRAVACGNPLDAEALVEREDGFDLILSDVLMPELTGPEMVAQLKQRGPAPPVAGKSAVAETSVYVRVDLGGARDH